MLPRDPFPPQFLEGDETVLASVKPALRAFLGIPALLVGAVSLSALAGVSAVAGNGPAETAFFTVFAALFLFNNLLWSRWLGRGFLVLLPLAFFVGLILAAAASGLSSPVTAADVRAVVAAELPLFAVLELALPLALFLLRWLHTFYALTDRRVIEVTGVFGRDPRWILLPDVGPITSKESWFGRWWGYGRVRFVDRSSRAGSRTGLAALALGRGIVGAEFFGVALPAQLSKQLEEIVAPARRVEATPASAGPTAPPSPTPAARSPAAPASPPPPGPAAIGARCPRCSTPLVFVAPASKFYCPSCGRYV